MEKSIRKNNGQLKTRDRLVELNTQLTTLLKRIADERIQYHNGRGAY